MLRLACLLRESALSAEPLRRVALTIAFRDQSHGVPDAEFGVALPADRSLFRRLWGGARHHLPLRLRRCPGLTVCCSAGVRVPFLGTKRMRPVKAGTVGEKLSHARCCAGPPAVCHAQCSVAPNY